jgi:hypothetical protein
VRTPFRNIRRGRRRLSRHLPVVAVLATLGVLSLTRMSSEAEYECGAKRYCGQMANCSEATHYFRNCGVTRLDGDADGVPCESLCR